MMLLQFVASRILHFTSTLWGGRRAVAAKQRGGGGWGVSLLQEERCSLPLQPPRGERFQIRRPLRLVLMRELQQIRPRIEPRVVAVVEHNAHRIAPDRLQRL